MLKILVAGAALVAAPTPGPAQGRPLPDAVIAFVGVHVLPMDTNRILRDQTVIVRDGRIAEVGARSSVRVPADARRIDAHGRWLMPGLADMHTHPQLVSDLPMYLRYGVTTVAHMGGSAQRWARVRDSVRAGQLPGPEVLVSVFLNGTGPGGGPPIAATVEDARRTVARGDSAGADFVKVYNTLTAEQFAAVMDEARRRRMPVMGHSVRALGLEQGFAAGQVAVAHAEEYIYGDRGIGVDTAQIARVAGFTRRAGAWVIPNLSAYSAIARQWGRPAVIDTFLATEDARLLPEFWRERWRRSDYTGRPGNIDARTAFLVELTRALHRAGVPLLLGTDSPGIPGVQAGASIHDDIRLMLSAGLTPFEALAAGTRNAGQFVGRYFRNAEPFGVVAAGQRADLLLLAANPLEDVAVLKRPVGVMARGRYFATEDLMRTR